MFHRPCLPCPILDICGVNVCRPEWQTLAKCPFNHMYGRLIFVVAITLFVIVATAVAGPDHSMD